MTKCETGGEYIHDVELLSPVEVFAPDVTFERVPLQRHRPAAYAPDDRRADAGA